MRDSAERPDAMWKLSYATDINFVIIEISELANIMEKCYSYTLFNKSN